MKFPNVRVWLAVLAIACLCVALGVALLRFDEATIHKANMTRDEGLRYFSESLPDSARNISCYLKAEGMGGLTRFARFDVDHTELHATVEALIARNIASYGRKSAFEPIEISRIPERYVNVPRKRAQDIGLEWWNPENIKKGYYRGEIGSHVIRLWVDEEHSRIYLYQTD